MDNFLSLLKCLFKLSAKLPGLPFGKTVSIQFQNSLIFKVLRHKKTCVDIPVPRNLRKGHRQFQHLREKRVPRSHAAVGHAVQGGITIGHRLDAIHTGQQQIRVTKCCEKLESSHGCDKRRELGRCLDGARRGDPRRESESESKSLAMGRGMNIGKIIHRKHYILIRKRSAYVEIEEAIATTTDFALQRGSTPVHRVPEGGVCRIFEEPQGNAVTRSVLLRRAGR